MRSMLLCLLSMPLAASCDRVSAPAYPICENKFEVVSLNDLEWEQVDPTHVIQLDMHAQEPVLALLPSAKACDLIAADFVFPGRQVPHWFRGNTFLKTSNPGQVEPVHEITRIYISRQGDGEGHDAETLVRQFLILNSARPGTVDLMLARHSIVEMDPQLLATVEIQPAVPAS